MKSSSLAARKKREKFDPLSTVTTATTQSNRVNFAFFVVVQLVSCARDDNVKFFSSCLQGGTQFYERAFQTMMGEKIGNHPCDTNHLSLFFFLFFSSPGIWLVLVGIQSSQSENAEPRALDLSVSIMNMMMYLLTELSIRWSCALLY